MNAATVDRLDRDGYGPSRDEQPATRERRVPCDDRTCPERVLGLHDHCPPDGWMRVGPWASQWKYDSGSATVAVFILSVLIFGLLLLAVIGGRHVMCDAYEQGLRYCPGYAGQP